MCGIAGGLGPGRPEVLRALRHRGPDAGGLVEVGPWWLAHTRLAVLDLDSRSDQPFVRGDLALSYNGEVWNFRAVREELRALARWGWAGALPRLGSLAVRDLLPRSAVDRQRLAFHGLGLKGACAVAISDPKRFYREEHDRLFAAASSLGHAPDGPWRFDDSVAACFDDMLARSIPQIEVMRDACLDVGSRFLRESPGCGGVLDLGASRGDALAPFVAAFPGRDHVAVETSPPMLAALRERFPSRVRVVDHDLRRGFPDARGALVLSVLTLQFTPMEHRLRILRDAFRATSPGGAIILVEKVLGASADLDELMVGAYLRRKVLNGYSPEEVERKRLSLEGVLVPVTARWNEDLLRGAGYAEVDCFWRWMNFAAWVAVRA